MPGIIAPQRRLWIPTPYFPTRPCRSWRSLAKQFFKNDSNAIYRNEGGNVIYDELTDLQDCCCDPICDGTNAVRMHADISGWVDSGPCQLVWSGFPCSPTSLDTCEITATSLNGSYSTTELYGPSGFGTAHTDTYVGGYFALGTEGDGDDPGVGPFVVFNGYACSGSDWVFNGTTKRFAYAMWACVRCEEIESANNICVDSSNNPGSFFVGFLYHDLGYDASDDFLSHVGSASIGMMLSTALDAPGRCIGMSQPFSESTFNGAQTGTVIHSTGRPSPCSPLNVCTSPTGNLNMLVDPEVTIMLSRS